MSGDLLQTKLYVPRLRSSLVPRPRLIEALVQGADSKLILISAPAGYGKTTLVIEWLDHLNEQEGDGAALCWLSLDEEDSQPRQYFQYLAEAIRVLPHVGTSLSQLLRSPLPQAAKAMMTAFVNDVTPVASPFFLVLDDYHTIESVEIDQSMAFLLDRMPPQMTLVIISRSDPSFPMSRLRARGDLVELRAHDLRFTTDEAARFLQQSTQITLSPSQIAALEERTEGWISGLQMAALSMKRQENADRFVDSFAGSNRFVMDYLLEEVLDQQPADVQQFLINTSVLDRLCADLCDAVHPSDASSQQMLEQLDAHNLFLIPLDNERRWFRYHHLFAGLLQQRLGHAVDSSDEGDKGRVAALHRRASHWYATHGHESKAIRHAFAADDVEEAARLLELVWRSMDATFQHDLWLSWARGLPDRLLQNRPVLCVGFAWAHINRGEWNKGEPYLVAAERWLEAKEGGINRAEMLVFDGEEFNKLPTTIASARAFSAQAVGDFQSTIRYAEAALSHLSEDDYLGRAIPNSLLALAYWASGALDSAYDALAAGMDGFAGAGNIMAAISGVFGMADIRVAQGRLDLAQQAYERALRLIDANGGLEVRGTEVLHLGLSELSRERGELVAAAACLKKAEALGAKSEGPVYHWRHGLALAQIKGEQGAVDDALALLDEVETVAEQLFVPDFRPVAAMRARIKAKQGGINAALAWARDQGLSVEDELIFLHEYEHITFARILMAQSQQDKGGVILEQALMFLGRLEEAARTGDRMGSLLEILILKALASQAGGHEAHALAAIQEGLALGEPQGYVRLFVVEGEPMAELLKRVIKQDNQQGRYATELLAAFEAPSAKSTVRMPLLDPLSERELEVLRYLATELSGPAIAQELMISLNTLRTHTKNIYSKLGASSRRTALRKAEALGLI